MQPSLNSMVSVEINYSGSRLQRVRLKRVAAYYENSSLIIDTSAKTPA